jgi:hypothetical protein
VPIIEHDQEPPEDRGVLKYQKDDNFFRQPITAQDLADVPKVEFDDFANKEEYLRCIRDIPFVVFIDVSDIAKYLKVVNIDGVGAIDVKRIAQIVCDFLGEDTNIPDMLWGDFEDDVAAEIQAKLGLEDTDTTAVLMGSPFNSSMEVVYEIANVVQRYLINAKFPIVEKESIYGVEEYSKGILALRVKSYEQFVEAYGGVDDDTAIEQQTLEQEETLKRLHDGVNVPKHSVNPDGTVSELEGEDIERRLFEQEMADQEAREKAFRESGATWHPVPSSDLDEYGHFDENDRWVNADGTKPVDNMKPYDDDRS